MNSGEFPADASYWPPELSRRRFIELMGASMALAGLGGCNRPPEKLLLPPVAAADRAAGGGVAYYATAMPWRGFARGILVRTNDGRPTKIEGNPAHPDSLGATDAITQAAVLSLYDPDRSQTPRRGPLPSTWAGFEADWLDRRRELDAQRGEGFALLTEPTTSPTLLGQVHALLERWPQARWYQHAAGGRYDDAGRQTDFDLAPADIILAVDADFLAEHPGSLRYARAFAARRRIEDGRVNANRLYVVEPTPTVTGSMADHRLAAAPARIRLLLNAVAQAIESRGLPATLDEAERRWVDRLARDLQTRAPKVVCVAGAESGDDLRRWADAMNRRLGAHGVTAHVRAAVRSDGDNRCAGDLNDLSAAIAGGQIAALAIVGANPAYTAPGSLEFGARLERVAWTAHLGPLRDETGRSCTWHLPEAHFLEAWGDLRAFDGTTTILQPAIAPLYQSRSAIELVALLNGSAVRDGYELVRATWQGNAPAAEAEQPWVEALSRGTLGKPSPALPGTAAKAIPDLAPPKPSLVLLLRPDPTIDDGRWANNGWLEELPKPVTNVVWGNAALVAPEFAVRHRIETGDVLRMTTATGVIEAPAWITPGQAEDCVTLHLGHGRTQAGSLGSGVGVDAYRVRPRDRDTTQIQGWTKIGRAEVVSTQGHFRMEGRDPVRVRRVDELRAREERPESKAASEPPSLFPEWRYAEYRWGMAIDLAACMGCSACVVACQAENNIPVVGKDQVSRGREMHWLRVDRYVVGDLADPVIVHQPVPCMQCEQAPCELVCPVAATVHSSEGLNDMTYNRCIGTRYCSNNCPYKVRRFNFFDYRAAADSPVRLQKNPAVTVRERGVMEKCTYCVQRINAARIAAEKENRRIRDGEATTACQQVCPTQAIVFGDIADPDGTLGKRKREQTNYALLEELNTRPRTTYLAKIVNPADGGTGG